MAENRQAEPFLNDVDATLQATLASIVVPDEVVVAETHPWASTLVRLESNLSGWQAILGVMAEQVQETQRVLTALDADLKRSLHTFAMARKHLQGAAELLG